MSSSVPSHGSPVWTERHRRPQLLRLSGWASPQCSHAHLVAPLRVVDAWAHSWWGAWSLQTTWKQREGYFYDYIHVVGILLLSRKSQICYLLIYMLEDKKAGSSNVCWEQCRFMGKANTCTGKIIYSTGRFFYKKHTNGGIICTGALCKRFLIRLSGFWVLMVPLVFGFNKNMDAC